MTCLENQRSFSQSKIEEQKIVLRFIMSWSQCVSPRLEWTLSFSVIAVILTMIIVLLTISYVRHKVKASKRTNRWILYSGLVFFGFAPMATVIQACGLLDLCYRGKTSATEMHRTYRYMNQQLHSLFPIALAPSSSGTILILTL